MPVPTSEKEPAGHAAHAVVRPCSAYVPAAHGSQASGPVALVTLVSCAKPEAPEKEPAAQKPAQVGVV